MVKYIRYSLLVLFIIIIAGCSNNNILDESNIKINNEDVKLLLIKDKLNDHSISFLLENNSNKDFTYDEYYIIEMYKDDKWFSLKNNLDTYKTLYKLLKWDSNFIEIDWSSSYGKLESGKYRIIKELKELDNENKFYSSLEFLID